MIDPITIGAAVIPALIDLAKGAANKWLAPANYKPMNVTEYIAMQESDTARFKAINEAGQGGTTYAWVEAVVRLQRPAVAFTALGVWAGLHLAGQQTDGVDNLASAVFFYLFGDRTLGYVKGNK